MKKKLVAVFTATSLVLGIGTIAMANSEKEIFENFNFHEMLPFMQKMHPEMNEEQLEEMFNQCHGDGGMMNSPNKGMKNMMNKKMGTDL